MMAFVVFNSQTYDILFVCCSSY